MTPVPTPGEAVVELGDVVEVGAVVVVEEVPEMRVDGSADLECVALVEPQAALTASTEIARIARRRLRAMV